MFIHLDFKLCVWIRWCHLWKWVQFEARIVFEQSINYNFTRRNLWWVCFIVYIYSIDLILNCLISEYIIFSSLCLLLLIDKRIKKKQLQFPSDFFSILIEFEINFRNFCIYKIYKYGHIFKLVRAYFCSSDYFGVHLNFCKFQAKLKINKYDFRINR